MIMVKGRKQRGCLLPERSGSPGWEEEEGSEGPGQSSSCQAVALVLGGTPDLPHLPFH